MTRLLLFYSISLSFMTGVLSASDFAVGVRASTLGYGVELYKQLHPKFNLRLNANKFDTTENFEEGNADYRAELDLKTVGLLVDWHPRENGFRVTAGCLYNGSEATFESDNVNNNVIFGGTPYLLNGRVTGSIETNEFAPYLGLGYGQSIKKGSRWSFLFDLGVMYQGDLETTINYTGTVNGGILTPSFERDLEEEAQNIEDEIADFKFYPVVSFGVGFRF